MYHLGLWFNNPQDVVKAAALGRSRLLMGNMTQVSRFLIPESSPTRTDRWTASRRAAIEALLDSDRDSAEPLSLSRSFLLPNLTYGLPFERLYRLGISSNPLDEIPN
jgi:hypothetical protein